MRNLMKAEWLRIVHSGAIKWMVLILLLFPAMSMLVDLQWYEHTLAENLAVITDAISMLLMLFSVIGFSIGMSYQNRTAYHEIMNGHNRHKIIISKAVLYTIIMTGGITVLYGIYFGIVSAMNGTGDIDNIPLRIVLFILVMIHVCVISVLLSIAAKKASGIVVIARLMVFESVFNVAYALYVFSLNNNETNKNITNLFIIGQITEIFTGKIDTNLILAVVLTLIIEVAIWYICAYHSLKRKSFK